MTDEVKKKNYIQRKKFELQELKKRWNTKVREI